MHVSNTVSKVGKVIAASFKRSFWDCPTRLFSRLEGNCDTVNIKNTVADLLSMWVWATVIGAVSTTLAPVASMCLALTAIGLVAEIISFGIVSKSAV